MIQKNPRVRKLLVRNSGAANGRANFMGTWKNAFFLQEKPMSIKFLVLGGGGISGFGGGGGSADFIFMGARIFLNDSVYPHGPALSKPLGQRSEGPTRKPRHASVFSTHSDMQAVPTFHCIRMYKGTFSTR